MSANDTFGVGGTTARGAGGGAFRLVAWLAPAGLLLLAGCGGGKGDVTGEVTYNGEPLPVGRVTFLSQVGNQEAVAGYVIRGKYTVKGCPAGPVKISVESLRPPEPEQLTAAKESAVPMAQGMKGRVQIPPELKELASGPPVKYVPIPPKYANPESSGLTYTVSRGSQTHDIPLKPE